MLWKKWFKNFLPCPQKMEHHRQHFIYRLQLKTKLLDIVDILVLALYFSFTIYTVDQEETRLIKIIIFTQYLACFVFRMKTRDSIGQYNNKKKYFVLHLTMYFFGFLLLQKLRTKTPALENEDIVVMIYLAFCFILVALFDIIANVLFIMITFAVWVSTTIVMVHIFLCFEGILDEYCLILWTIVLM